MLNPFSKVFGEHSKRYSRLPDWLPHPIVVSSDSFNHERERESERERERQRERERGTETERQRQRTRERERQRESERERKRDREREKEGENQLNVSVGCLMNLDSDEIDNGPASRTILQFSTRYELKTENKMRKGNLDHSEVILKNTHRLTHTHTRHSAQEMVQCF